MKSHSLGVSGNAAAGGLLSSSSPAVRTVAHPDRILSYFRAEWPSLLIVMITGLIYNIGLLAGPWYEGRLAQCLYDIFRGDRTAADIVRLALLYAVTIAIVQIARFLKRLYVRVFANNINRSMKEVIYANLLHTSKSALEQEDAGSVLTKAITDVEACAEGMRKFTTELFDTGVALAAYVWLLLSLDWRLGLLCLIFPPVSYFIADRMKTVVTRTNAAFKKSTERLSAATMDRITGAVTYRVFGCEPQRDADYENHLKDYERKAVSADIWVSAMPPIYNVISMISVLFLFWFGARNVMGTGWKAWDIAAFTTFLSCYTKLSVKSSHAAKLFNAVQKAQVSWKRIKPLMRQPAVDTSVTAAPAARLEVRNLGVSYKETDHSDPAADTPAGYAAPGAESEADSGSGHVIFSGLSFTAEPGTIIGVTGPVACGKSSLGRAFLCESPYEGSIRFAGKELAELPEDIRRGIVGYLGHDPELLGASVRDNVLMGMDESDNREEKHGNSGSDPSARDHSDTEDSPLWKALGAVCLDREIAAMPEGVETRVGTGGVRLSGGQQQRLALARTLAHPRPIYVLDDPFSALDRPTEIQVYRNLKKNTQNSIVLLLSHRLYLFPQTDQVIWMENGTATVSTHRELMKTNPAYRELYEIQATDEKNGETLSAGNQLADGNSAGEGGER